MVRDLVDFTAFFRAFNRQQCAIVVSECDVKNLHSMSPQKKCTQLEYLRHCKKNLEMQNGKIKKNSQGENVTD